MLSNPLSTALKPPWLPNNSTPLLHPPTLAHTHGVQPRDPVQLFVVNYHFICCLSLAGHCLTELSIPPLLVFPLSSKEWRWLYYKIQSGKMQYRTLSTVWMLVLHLSHNVCSRPQIICLGHTARVGWYIGWYTAMIGGWQNNLWHSRSCKWQASNSSALQWWLVNWCYRHAIFLGGSIHSCPSRLVTHDLEHVTYKWLGMSSWEFVTSEHFSMFACPILLLLSII